jgi:hypothetical protein
MSPADALAALILAATDPSGAAAGLLCTVDNARNESTGQAEPTSPSFFHPLETLVENGDVYTRSESRTDTRGSTEVEHRIDRRTGTFETVSMQTVHEVGEQYLIRITGTCKPTDHRPLAQPPRY